MRFTTEALVIKEMNVGENDKLLTLLTRDRGILRAFAAGAKSIKSKKGAATGLLSYSSFTVLEKKDTYKIYEATPIRVFFGAGSDVVSLALSQYFCELCAVLVPDETDSADFLRLVLNSLHFLTVEKRPPALLKAITELRCAVLAGYSPDLVACASCGKFEDERMYFNPTDGSLLCGECREGGQPILLDQTLLTAMRHIVYAPLASLYAFRIPDEAAKRLSRITEQYITLQTEHRFLTLDFYNSIGGEYELSN